MAQFFTSFDDSPSLTEQWHTGDGANSIETTGLPTGTSDGAALKITLTTDSRYAVSWDAVGTPTGDVEFLMRWQVDANFSALAGSAGRATICGGGNSTAEDAYFAGHTVNADAQNQVLGEYDAATANTLGTNSQTLSINTWYWTRIEKTGTTIRYRTWSGTIGDEPATWDVSVTDATHGGGFVGPGQFESTQTLWIDKMGCGTGGDAAPDEPVVQTITAAHLDLSPTLHLATFDTTVTIPAAHLDLSPTLHLATIDQAFRIQGLLLDLSPTLHLAALVPGEATITANHLDLSPTLHNATVEGAYTIPALTLDLSPTLHNASIAIEQFIEAALLDLGLELFPAANVAEIAQAVPIFALKVTNARYNLRSTGEEYILVWTGERYELRNTQETYRLLATTERYRLRRS